MTEQGSQTARLYSPLIERALRLAARGHYHQFRKRGPSTAGCGARPGAPLPSSCVPYITHLVGTMCILARLELPDTVLAAALLHDYLEDVPDADASNTVRRAVGDEVLSLVLEVTENKRPEHEESATWELRKREQLAKIRRMPEEAVLIKAADVLHNILSLNGDLATARDSGSVWDRFNAPPERELWYFESVLAATRERLGDHALVAELGRAIDDLTGHVPRA